MLLLSARERQKRDCPQDRYMRSIYINCVRGFPNDFNDVARTVGCPRFLVMYLKTLGNPQADTFVTAVRTPADSGVSALLSDFATKCLQANTPS